MVVVKAQQGRRSPARVVWAALAARPRLALLALLGLLYLPWLGAIPINGTLEGNRLQAAREMLADGDWLVPHLGGEVYLSKPPLHPWTIALFSRPFGEVNLWSGRLPSVLSALLVCLLVHGFARRELGARVALCAALGVGGALVFAEKAMRAELETELALFTVLAIGFLWGAGTNAARRTWFTLAAGLALGAAVMVKGPPPLFMFVAAALGAGWARAFRKQFLANAAVALFLALALAAAWVVPVVERLGFERAWSSFNVQFLERLVRAGVTNVEPFWFYVPALLAGLAPLTLLLPNLALVWPRALADERARARAGLLWGWALGSLIVFSVSSGKETRYLLPTVPAWALLIAWGWTRARVAGRFAGWNRVLARALGLVTWSAPFAWLAAGTFAFPEARLLVLATAGAALGARLAFRWSIQVARPGLVLSALVLAAGSAKVAWAGTALAKQRREIPIEAVGRAVAAQLAPGEPWGLLGGYRSWWQFAVGRPCLALDDWSALLERREERADLRHVLAPSALVPADAVGVAREMQWSVEGDEYVLLRVRP
jgi:4-amino-4-deoxy-L-arabinose transferase-like glycosyltransferase